MSPTLVESYQELTSSAGILRFLEYDRNKVSHPFTWQSGADLTTGTHWQNKTIAQGVGSLVIFSWTKP
jgi:hypothetical protein